MKGWKDERMKGWKDERMKGWKDERMKGWKDEWMNGKWNNECINGLIYLEIKRRNDQSADQPTN